MLHMYTGHWVNVILKQLSKGIKIGHLDSTQFYLDHITIFYSFQIYFSAKNMSTTNKIF